MKSVLLAGAFLLFVQSTFAASTYIGLPKTCEDALPADTCTTLREIAGKFKERVEIVNQAVIDAYSHHITQVEKVKEYVQHYLVDKATNIQCTDFLSAENCQKITDLATAAHLKLSEVNRAVREAVAHGADTVQKIYQEAITFLKSEITCEKVLGDQVCKSLEASAIALKEKVETVRQAVADALEEGKRSAQDIIHKAKVILAKGSNIKCEDVLSNEQCAKLTEIVNKLHLQASEVKRVVSEAVATGVSNAKEIYGRAIGFLINDVKNVKCEDIASQELCTKVRDFATKVHLTVRDATDAIVEAIVEGANTIDEEYEKAKTYLTSLISCDDVLGKTFCESIRKTSNMFGVKLAEVDKYMRELIANGVQKGKEMYQKAIDFIVERWTSVFGDEQMNKRSLDDEERTKALVKHAVRNVIDALFDESMNHA